MTTYRPRWGAMAAFAVALAMASTALAATPAMANSGNCVAAERAYKIEQKATVAAADAYALCVAQNFARDDCSGRADVVAKQQRKFALAVADVRGFCSQ